MTDYLHYYPQVLKQGLGEYDIVHANNGLTAPFALSQPSRPVVVTFWGSDLMSDRGWLRRVSRVSASMADRVILPSHELGEYLTAEYTHMPFPVDTAQFRPIDRRTARKRVGWEPDERVVLFPYDPDRPEKDYERARRVVDAADLDVQLRTVTGKAYEEMPYYLNASDAVLVTSKRESGPMIVREAAACNVPVVATDVGFVSETLEDVCQSTVCRSDDELTGSLELVLDADRRPNSRETVDELGPDQFGTRLAQLYQSTLDGQAGAT